MRRPGLLALGAQLLCGCLEVGQAELSIPLSIAGTAAVEPVANSQGWLVELQLAELAFGPLYLCAGYQAGGLCETARAEWVDSAVVDTLAAEARLVGELRGVSGPVRSWMYDLGITSLLTEQQPVALAAAQSLGGSSVRLAGVARKEARSVPFLLELPVQQEEATELGVSVVRKSSSDTFEHELRGAEAGLTVRFAPAAWVRDIDFEALASAPVSPVELTPGSQAERALRNALVAGERPAFEWSKPPVLADDE